MESQIPIVASSGGVDKMRIYEDECSRDAVADPHSQQSVVKTCGKSLSEFAVREAQGASSCLNNILQRYR